MTLNAGQAGYIACCMAPCKLCSECWQKICGAKSREPAADAAPLLESIGTRRVLLLGLDGAGKSSTTWMCDHRDIGSLPQEDVQEPTQGFNRLTVKDIPLKTGNGLLDLDLMEVGGNERIRPYWGRYITTDIDVVVFMVDSTQPERFEEVAKLLVSVCDSARNVSRGRRPQLMLVATKGDSADARPAAQVHTELRTLADTGVDWSRISLSELTLRDIQGRLSLETFLGDVANLAK